MALEFSDNSLSQIINSGLPNAIMTSRKGSLISTVALDFKILAWDSLENLSIAVSIECLLVI